MPRSVPQAFAQQKVRHGPAILESSTARGDPGSRSPPGKADLIPQSAGLAGTAPDPRILPVLGSLIVSAQNDIESLDRLGGDALALSDAIHLILKHNRSLSLGMVEN